MIQSEQLLDALSHGGQRQLCLVTFESWNRQKLMDDQDIVQARLKEIMRMGEAGAERLGESLHRQHYSFAHKLVPCIIEEHFDDLISGLADGSSQEWICRIWKDHGDVTLANYSSAVYPVCQFIKASNEIGVVYFVMPAPRTSGEALYTGIVF